MRRPVVCWVFLILLGLLSTGQTTQGIITGSIRDQATNTPIAGAGIEYEQLDTNTKGATVSASGGNYYTPLLPPGSYRVRVSSKNYQAGEVYGVTLTVGGYVRIDFELRPLADVWERQQYGRAVFRDNTVLPFFGPDVDPSYVGTFEPERGAGGQLEPSISEVIDPRVIATLPLAGRDIYTALVLQPGVAADSSTTRSLGLSANGQRPSSSNFLLDGIEENDQLLSGPALQLAPEMIQEYRVSTNNFSAEYGRTAGYIANAVTRSAAASWHGIAYSDLNNDVLNANTFDHNATGLPRTALHQIEAGFSAGGAVPHTRILTWTALDYFGSRSFADPQTFELPTQTFANSLPPSTRASQLLHEYPPVQWANASFGDYGPVTLSEPVTLRRLSGLERVDYALSQRQHVTARIAGDDENRPDFYWSPYGESPFSQSTIGIAAALTSAWTPSVSSEIRAGYETASRSWDVALPNLPQNEVPIVTLPGSCCGQVGLGWHDEMPTAELAANLTIAKGPHLIKIGVGILNVRPRTGFAIPTGGSFVFATPEAFANDQPFQYTALFSRSALNQALFETPDTNRSYSYSQPDAFVQEDWRISSRFTLNAGLRYDRFPAPVNTGAVPDQLVTLGPGSTFDAQVATAYLAPHTGALYSANANNVAARFGFSWLMLPSRSTVLRGGFGTFFDRPFDNIWMTASANDLAQVTFYAYPPGYPCNLQPYYTAGNYQSPPPNCFVSPPNSFLDATLFESGLRAPRVQSAFLSLQQPLGRNLFLELDGTGSRGRDLLATDVINRQAGIFPPGNGLPPIDYRTNEGFSDYSAFSAVAKYRSGPATFNVSYTWSHSIDNQSDPLLGEYFDLGFSNQSDRYNPGYYGAFTFSGNPYTDRGNSDFDQRQNLVGWFVVALPSRRSGALAPLLRNWSTAGVFAVRSGLPYSVYAVEVNCVPLCNTRASLTDPAIAYESVPVNAGERILNPAAFTFPAPGEDGNTGRNEFEGPGFWNLDLSLARTFALTRVSEQAHLILRADAFNIFNHTNLQNPQAFLGVSSVRPDFGIALYGRVESENGFPALTPLIENPRIIHFLLRFEF